MPLMRILERLEIEHVRHAGQENGHLYVSYSQFVEAGLSRKAIKENLEIGELLGLLEVIINDQWVGYIRQPNTYRLTYLPAKGRRAPTDEWLNVTSAQIQSIMSRSSRRAGQALNIHIEKQRIA